MRGGEGRGGEGRGWEEEREERRGEGGLYGNKPVAKFETLMIG